MRILAQSGHAGECKKEKCQDIHQALPLSESAQQYLRPAIQNVSDENVCEKATPVRTVSSTEMDAEVCGLKTLAEQVAWAAGYDNCRGKGADDAVSSIRNEVDEKRSYAKKLLADKKELKRYLQASKSRLTADEMLRSLRYLSDRTADEILLTSLYIENGYERINQVLWHGPRASDCLSGLVSAQTAAFETQPEFHGLVWRGVDLPDGVIESYRPGQEITWPSFSSTSRSMLLAKAFATGKTPVLFKILSRHCRDIAAISPGGEEEVLCLPGTHVKVTSKESPNIIVLEEAE